MAYETLSDYLIGKLAIIKILGETEAYEDAPRVGAIPVPEGRTQKHWIVGPGTAPNQAHAAISTSRF